MSKIITDEEKINKILDRGIIVKDKVFPNIDEFKEVLLSGKKLRFYIGFDATADTLHLSHAKNLMLLEEFRKLGHEVILLFGDFTARIGDPSGQNGTREVLSQEKIINNIKSWKKQIKHLITLKGKNPVKIKFNSKWLAKLSMEDVLNLASNVTVQQMIERDMFQKRIKEGKHIFLHEFMYPLMQGYDSVAMDVDVELCGTDQIFNALMGRKLLHKIKNKNKFVVSVNLMENPKTNELMSKSKGTGVFLNTKSTEMFGSIMSQPDEMTEVLFKNCTSVSINTVQNLLKNPMIAKKRVALEIVSKVFGSVQKAEEAQENWEKVFSKNEIPTSLKNVLVKKGTLLVDVLLSQKIVSSKSNFSRLVKERAITHLELNKKIEDIHYLIIKGTYKIGKKRFIKIIIK